MQTTEKAKLEKKINEWLNENCEDLSFEYDVFWHPTLVREITNAAEAVFDSCVHAQRFTGESNID